MVKRSGDLKRVKLNGGESFGDDAAAGRVSMRDRLEEMIAAARRCLETADEASTLVGRLSCLVAAADYLQRARAVHGALAYLVEVAS